MIDTLLAWGHVNLNVSDLEPSIAFYEGLGFPGPAAASWA